MECLQTVWQKRLGHRTAVVEYEFKFLPQSLKMAKLLDTLVQASEKSACIARAWRCQNDLFHLLVEEKVGEAKNERFVRDFKTLADVLVQEVVKYDVTKQVSRSILCSL